MHFIETIGYQIDLFAHKLFFKSYPNLVFITTILSTKAISSV